MFSPTCFLRLRFLVLEVDLLMFHPIQVRRGGSVFGVGVLVAGIVSLWRPVSGLFLHRSAEYRGLSQQSAPICPTTAGGNRKLFAAQSKRQQ